MQDKTATAFTGKLREVLVRQRDQEILQGVIEIDGGYFCGKPRRGRIRIKANPKDVAASIQAKLRGEKPPRCKARSRAEARNWARPRRGLRLATQKTHGLQSASSKKWSSLAV